MNEDEVSDLHAEINLSLTMLRMGFGPTELHGADADTWKCHLVTYKTLLDWVRSKNWSLSPSDIKDIENVIRETLPGCEPTTFNEREQTNA